jgi:archaellum component FlaF (FlaF/FlaG flagellin family)
MGGYGVSAGLLILLIGLLVSATVIGPTIADAGEEISESLSAQTDRQVEVHNADFEIASVTFINPGQGTTIQLNNTGTEPLPLDSFSFVVDGVYEEPESVEINGDTTREHLLPGESATFSFDITAEPTRVHVTSIGGLAERWS